MQQIEDKKPVVLVQPACHNEIKHLKVGKKSANITVLSELFSYSSVHAGILIILAVDVLLHSWGFSQVNQNFKFQEKVLR